mgnify:CR=1 FL=1
MESVTDFVLLLDIYGELLSKTQREVLDMRCNADLSLSEIAEEMGGVTRQSVSNSMKKGEQRLTELEQALGFAKRLKRLSAQLGEAKQLCAALSEEYGGSRRLGELSALLRGMESEL